MQLLFRQCRLPAWRSASLRPWITLLFFILVTGIGSATAMAASPEASEDAEAKTAYLDLDPAFVVNVGEPSTRVGFAKVDLALRLEGKADLERAQHHEPALRDIVVSLLSGQPLKTVQDSDGRESLRMQALDRVQAFLQEEEGAELVTDLLFTSFVVQR